jgi:hypothetical protein
MSFQIKILNTLTELKNSHPKLSIGKHIATAIDSKNMNDLFLISDKELYKTLINYQTGLDMDILHDDDDIEQIIKSGKNLWADQY